MLPPLVAVSDAVWVALIGAGAGGVAVVGTVVVALLNRDTKQRQTTVNKTVDDFESAWTRRGQLLDGLGDDLDAAHRRIATLEQREDECQAELADSRRRLDELEGIIERRNRPRA